jgi:hypothetical protein
LVDSVSRIGEQAPLTTDQARATATHFRGDVREPRRDPAKADPTETRDALGPKRAANEAPNVAALADACLAECRAKLKVSTLAEYARLIARHLPKVGLKRGDAVRCAGGILGAPGVGVAPIAVLPLRRRA